MSQCVYIILPVHNRRVITEKFVDCLAAQSYSNYHLVLIDDGSTDGTSAMVDAKIGQLTIIRGQGDWWWAGSLQQGIDWLNKQGVNDRDIVMFANDDIVFEADFLAIAVALLEDRGGMLLPQVFDEKVGAPVETGIAADINKLSFKVASSPEQINCLPTRGLFTRLETIQKIGGFYPRLLPHYLSDYEYTIRAGRRGVVLSTSSKLTIRFDDKATGFRSFDNLSLVDFIKRYFSIKSAANPIYWTTFILLTEPVMHALWHVLRIWLSTAKLIFKQLRLHA